MLLPSKPIPSHAPLPEVMTPLKLHSPTRGKNHFETLILEQVFINITRYFFR